MMYWKIEKAEGPRFIVIVKPEAEAQARREAASLVCSISDASLVYVEARLEGISIYNGCIIGQVEVSYLTREEGTAWRKL